MRSGGPVGGQEQVARQLHGQGGGALRAPMGAQVVDQRAEDAEEIDAAVGLEGLVLNGDDGLPQNRGEVVVIDDDAPLQGKGADHPALVVVQVGRGGRPIALQVVDLRQIDRVDQRQPGQRAGNNRQGDEDEAAPVLPASLQARTGRFRRKPVRTAKAARLLQVGWG